MYLNVERASVQRLFTLALENGLRILMSGGREENMAQEKNKQQKGVSRREFLTGAGLVIGGAAVGAAVGTVVVKSGAQPAAKIGQGNLLSSVQAAIPVSTAYLVVDSLKCCGCQTCMMACSMVHDGVADTSLSRMQVTQDPFVPFPQDLNVYQCRQCVTPNCVLSCPTGACHVDDANGNVRVIDQDKCIGCGTCITACPHPPHRTVFNPDTKKASKCDLCINTPYWGEKGGPNGKQACISVCTMDALKIVTQTPPQGDTSGYDVNLRTGGEPVPTTP
jgi:protein NrfC